MTETSWQEFLPLLHSTSVRGRQYPHDLEYRIMCTLGIRSTRSSVLRTGECSREAWSVGLDARPTILRSC